MDLFSSSLLIVVRSLPLIVLSVCTTALLTMSLLQHPTLSAMFPTLDSPEDLNHTIESILDLSKTERCSLAVGHYDSEMRKHMLYKSFTTASDGDASGEGDRVVYFIASLAKKFIAFGISKIIEVLSNDKDSPYNILYGAWDHSFTTVFNEVRQRNNQGKMGALLGDPTVRKVLHHSGGVYPMNHVLLAPDGTSILSAREFLDYIPHYAKATSGMPKEAEYSNANYALLGLLIEAVSGKPLARFLEDEIFKPLGMHLTYTSAAEFGRHPPQFRASPHHVFKENDRRSINFSGPADTMDLASLGAYSCTADLATFEWALLSAQRGVPVLPWLTERFVKIFFQGQNSLDAKGNGYTNYGLYTALDTEFPGSHSLNRLLSDRLNRKSKSSVSVMGIGPHDEKDCAYYQAGSATGWTCSSFLVLKREFFIIVLTNTSGPLDASDLISRLLLQEVLELRPIEVKKMFGAQRKKPSELPRKHIMDLASQMLEENLEVFQDFEMEDAAPDVSAAECGGVCGTYKNEGNGQSLVVSDVDGKLRVTIGGRTKRSGFMRFVRKGENFRICSLREKHSPLAVDCFGDWRNLEFTPTRNNNNEVKSFSRQGVYLTDVFHRTEA
jgi:CubicO group peptidase (beta-lactamase class C family)